MSEIVLPIVLFALGLLLLIKGGDWFVDGAVGIAHKFKMPELLIGATVVSIGTTLPEVMVSSSAAISGQGATAYGNAIGSIICNTSLIAAISIAVKPSQINKKSLKLPVIFFFSAAILYSAVAYIFGDFSRIFGIVLLAIFAVYMFITIRSALKIKDDNEEEYTGNIKKDTLFLVLGAAVIAVGAKLLVNNGTIIAKYFGVPESVIALTFVALGTSLPELVTAITSLVKGHGSLSLGNIIGANLFNLVLVSGASISIAPFTLPAEKTFMGMNASLIVDVPLMLFLMAFMTIPALIRGKLSRFQGIAMLLIYAAFCAFQFLA